MELYRKIRMNVLAACCVCSLAIAGISPRTTVAENCNDALAADPLHVSAYLSNPDLADFWVRQSDANIGRAAALAAITRIPNPAILYGLGSFLLTLDTENDIIVPKVRKNSIVPQAGSFFRGAEMMRLTAVFISWTFSRTIPVLLSPVIGNVDLTDPANHSSKILPVDQFCPSFREHTISAVQEKHNDQSRSLRPASVGIGSDKTPIGTTGLDWRGIK